MKKTNKFYLLYNKCEREFMKNNFKVWVFRYKKILNKYRVSTYKIQHYTQETAIKYKEENNQALYYLINLYLITDSN